MDKLGVRTHSGVERPLAIGDKVWIFDGNRRVYAPGSHGGPIYREHFVVHTIAGETRSSWVLDNGWKINKTTGSLRFVGKGNYAVGAQVFTSEYDVEDACYVYDNRPDIANLVLRCRNAKVLRTIHGILKGNE